jgi:hypothetical protein
MVIGYMIFSLNIDPTNQSREGCKVYYFFNYSLNSLSPWCLVYISVEKYIAITYPHKRLLFKNIKNQILFFIILFLFIMLYSIYIPLNVDILNIDNSSNYCNFIDEKSYQIAEQMNFANFCLVPFLLMIIFSILLIRTIFKSRQRVTLNDSSRQQKRLRQDIKFTISLLSMNLLFIILNTPYELYVIFPYIFLADYSYDLVAYIYFSTFAINFYLFLFTNSLFRSEFISLFSFEKKINSQNNQQRPIRPNV